MKQRTNENSDGNNEKRRVQIIEAAISVMQEKGVSGSSMNDFIRASGLSKGGVYHHFAGKEDLLVCVLKHFFEENISELTESEIVHESALMELKHMLVGHKEMIEKMGELNQLMMDFFSQSVHVEAFKEQFYQQYVYFQNYIAEVVQRGVDEGEFVDTVNPKAVASGIIGVFDGTAFALLVAPDVVEFPNYSIESALLMVEGMRKR